MNTLTSTCRYFRTFQKFILAILSILGFALSLQAQQASDIKERLAAMSVCLYPDSLSLQKSSFQTSSILAQPLADEDILDTFDNVSDLEWLRPVAKDNKVVLFGEIHYHESIHLLRNRILFALNQFDSFPCLAIELQYSMSAFLDYYVSLRSDNEARRFYTDVLYGFVTDEQFYQLLEHIRQWNKKFRGKRIHLVAYDIEHDYQTTLRNIVLPYFRGIDSSFKIDIPSFITLDFDSLLPDLRLRIVRAKAVNHIGAFAFLTPVYIEAVIDNLESLYNSQRFGMTFDYVRQRALIRNLTDSRFLGKYFLNGKVMIFAGGYHTATHVRFPDNANFFREGSYLNYDFEPTKGKTFSIFARGYALRLGPMSTVNLDSCLRQGGEYNGIVSTFQSAYREGLVSSDQYYLIHWVFNALDSLWFRLAYANRHTPIFIQKIRWQELFAVAKTISTNEYNYARRVRDEIERYDAYIIVPQSNLIRAKPKLR